MSKPPYIFDTNMFSDLVRQENPELLARLYRVQDRSLILSEAVLFEIERGLLHKGASKQLAYFQETVMPLFNVVPVQRVDWQSASVLWATLRKRGIQLSDVDLILAALTLRLKGILITDDADFNAVALPRENWLRHTDESET